MKTVIECRELGKRFSHVQALNTLNLDVPERCVFGFLGPNGAGKTTAIRIMTGLLQADEGSCTVAGLAVTARSTRHQAKIGYLAQEPKYYGWLTGRELLHMSGRMFGMSKAQASLRASELLGQTGLDHAADRRIEGYSGGMQQRLGIAQAIMHRPEVVLLDEPVSALDPVGRREVLELIAEIAKEATVLMSTHILADVERVCSHIAVMRTGRVVASGERDALLQEYAPAQMSLTCATAEAAGALADALAHDSSALSRQDGTEVFVDLSFWEREQYTILDHVKRTGVTLVSAVPKRASLEDLFMHLMKEAV
ncbi:MAG: ABC transporter ATP-binding protein [Spirochaetaceae bacterium]